MPNQQDPVREALQLAREYVENASQRMYDGTNGHGIRKEALRRLALIDAALALSVQSAEADALEIRCLRAEVGRLKDGAAVTAALWPVQSAEPVARKRDVKWEADMLDRELDALGIPRFDNDAHYSLWGRVEIALACSSSPASVGEMEKDAARYRWLRAECEKHGGLTIAKVDTFALIPWSGDDPDSRIDRAMRTPPSTKGGEHA